MPLSQHVLISLLRTICQEIFSFKQPCVNRDEALSVGQDSDSNSRLYASQSVNKDYERKLLSFQTHRPVSHLNERTIPVSSINKIKKRLYFHKYIQIPTPFKFQHHMLNLRYNLLFFSICTHSQKENLCTHSCLRPQRINTDYLLLLARHIYPQLKTPSSFESVAGRCFMQSRCTGGNMPNKRHIIASHNLRAEY